MGIFHRIELFVAKTFKTTVEIFLEALQMSPNAQGYVSGSITELLLKNKLVDLGYEVKRVKEKWEGVKHPNHHGDFYFKKANTKLWYVLESKGVKSNTEEWNKLYNRNNLKNTLIKHSSIVHWIDCSSEIEQQVDRWLDQELPFLINSQKLYTYEEVQDYLSNPPKKETPKFAEMRALAHFSREQISAMIKERLKLVMSKIMVLDTHFVSGTSGASKRTQATPRKDEFNLISINIVLRYDRHKFLFANPNQLESSGEDANHLQQNYIMGFVFPKSDGTLKLDLSDEWFEDFEDAYETLSPSEAISEKEMQVDNRNIVVTDK